MQKQAALGQIHCWLSVKVYVRAFREQKFDSVVHYSQETQNLPHEEQGKCKLLLRKRSVALAYA